jgi:glutaredoxin 3
MSNITIYIKTGCPYCAAAKKHYSDQGIAFEEINIHEDPTAKDKILKLTGGEKIVPVIVEDGKVMKGFGGG